MSDNKFKEWLLEKCKCAYNPNEPEYYEAKEVWDYQQEKIELLERQLIEAVEIAWKRTSCCYNSEMYDEEQEKQEFVNGVLRKVKETK